MEPQADSGTSVLREDDIVLDGLPIPASGSYTIHVDNNEWTVLVPGTGQPVRGDVDGDGTVSLNDILQIVDIILNGQ